ncbi:MAG: hypothetical protein IPG12_00650 [Saprospiraceae bacterium]|nr:hypothetical protein [Saprospiraceae bacterium]
MHINEIEIEHIGRLDAINLTKLLHHLLNIELSNNKISGKALVPFNITTGDEGNDGKVEWSDGPTDTKWLKSRYCVFQNKATNLGPGACYEEILLPEIKGRPRKLKHEIEKLINKSGCYVLFNNKNLNDTLINKRIQKIRAALKDAGIKNSDDIKIEVYDNNSIKDWVNENIGSVAFVQDLNDIRRLEGFRTWNEWAKTLEGAEVKYQRDATIDNNLSAIIDSIIIGKPFRLIGHSGLGKTRLALEAFRQIEFMRTQVLYFEIGINGQLVDLTNFIISNKTKDGIIVIDGCDEEEHQILSGLVKKLSKFKLLTIDIANESNELSYLKLERNFQREIVKKIIDDFLGLSHDQSDRDYLSNLCEGYPWMAVKFCEQISQNGIEKFSGILPDEFIKKLIFSGPGKNESEYEVIRACSVFSTFGFLDDELIPILSDFQKGNLEEQSEFIRINILDEAISSSKFYEICKKYRKEDIIEKRGTQYVVKPTILAINLASNWLLNTPPTKIISIITLLKGKPLSLKFVERLRDLDQLDKAQYIVHELWGPNRPFGLAEVLNTEWGSLLFRYVVEVNPISTVNTLTSEFLTKSKDELLGIVEGRRNLIWALEKLSFRKETFKEAAKVLLAFAVSENERWSNNATNEFISFFKIYLAGTEANFDDRFEIIEYGLNKNDTEYEKIIIKSLHQALSDYRFSRMLGAENQGSRAPLKDFEPALNEIIKYRKKCFERLNHIIKKQSNNLEQAKISLAHSYNCMVRIGELDLVIESLRYMTFDYTRLWQPGINSIKLILAFPEGISKGNIQKLESLISRLSPSSIEDKLATIVSIPEWNSYEKDADGSYIDKPKIAAQELADFIIDSNIDISANLQTLMKGEQRQAFNFGLQLGKRIENKDAYLNMLFMKLKLNEPRQRNIDLIGGFVVGADNEELARRAYKLLQNEKESLHFLFYLIKFTNPNFKDFYELIEICREEQIPISFFRNFNFGFNFKNLSIEEIINLINELANYSREGKWTALTLIDTICFHNENNWTVYKTVIREIICSENLLIDNGEIQFDFYHWKDSVLRILSEFKDINFARIIANQIVEHCETSIFASMSDNLLPILEKLISDYFLDTWDIIGRALISDSKLFWNLKGILNSGFSKIDGILFSKKIDQKILINWIRDNLIIAPKRIASFMPIDSIVAGKSVWHPISKFIFDEFGDDPKVLDEIDIHSYSWSGSLIPLFEKRKAMVSVLKNHPKINVQNWADKEIKYFEQRIKEERLKEEERGWS